MNIRVVEIGSLPEVMQLGIFAGLAVLQELQALF